MIAVWRWCSLKVQKLRLSVFVLGYERIGQWINTYNYLSQEKFSEKNNIMYVNYEYLCENPQKVFENIVKKINLYNLSFDSNYKFKLSFKKVEIQEDTLLLNAKKIFNKLKKLR